MATMQDVSTSKPGAAREEGASALFLPNVLRDERGTAMTEFVIVLPFLATSLLAVLFFTDLNRFQVSTHYHAYVQVWRSAARGVDATTRRSDDVAFNSVNGVPIPGALLSLGTIQNGIMIEPPTNVSDFPAIMLYEADIPLIGNGLISTPFEKLGIAMGTFDDRPFSASEVDSSFGSEAVYRNSTFLQPFMGAMNSFLGKRDEQGEFLDINEVEIETGNALIYDPHSVYWDRDWASAPFNEEAMRLRHVDAFTINRDPRYFAAGIAQTFVSGNLLVLVDIPTFLEDVYGGGVSMSNLQNAVPGFPPAGMDESTAGTVGGAFGNTSDWMQESNDAIQNGTDLSDALDEINDEIAALELKKQLFPDTFTAQDQQDLDTLYDQRAELVQMMNDPAYAQASQEQQGWFDSLANGFQAISEFLEQAEPMRKVDKRMDKQHDVDGEADYGEEKIADEKKLQGVGGNDAWRMIQ